MEYANLNNEEVFMSKEIDETLRCTLCRKVYETHCRLVYSRGRLVCLECKKVTQAGDNRAFDRDMDLRKY